MDVSPKKSPRKGMKSKVKRSDKPCRTIREGQRYVTDEYPVTESDRALSLKYPIAFVTKSDEFISFNLVEEDDSGRQLAGAAYSKNSAFTAHGTFDLRAKLVATFGARFPGIEYFGRAQYTLHDLTRIVDVYVERKGFAPQQEDAHEQSGLLSPGPAPQSMFLDMPVSAEPVKPQRARRMLIVNTFVRVFVTGEQHTTTFFTHCDYDRTHVNPQVTCEWFKVRKPLVNRTDVVSTGWYQMSAAAELRHYLAHVGTEHIKVADDE